MADIDCVLIDDDILVHMTWKMAAREKGVGFLAISTKEEFLRQASALPRDVLIYIDSNLGGGVKGQDVARELSTAGFTNLYLATGYSPDQFGAMPWIKGIVGKDPPWA